MAEVKELITLIFDSHQEIKPGDPINLELDYHKAFRNLEDEIRGDFGSETLIVNLSIGSGKYAFIPGIIVLDKRVSETTENGVYIAILFRKDMSGFYLTLTQGVKKPLKVLGKADGGAHITATAQAIRPLFQNLTEHGFKLDENMDLMSTSGPALNYQQATIAYKFFDRNTFHEDEELGPNIRTLIEEYQYNVGNKNRLEKFLGVSRNISWIFQCVPQKFDLAQALVKGQKDFTWLANQFADEISKGDDVFLWISGSEGGLVAIGEVLSEAREQHMLDSEKPFVLGGLPSDEAVRVQIKIAEIIEASPDLNLIKNDPRLIDMPFRNLQRGTNFKVRELEAEALRDLANGGLPPKVYKIAPGEEAQFWEDCLREGYICVGWDDVGDLSKISDYRTFREDFKSLYPYEGNETQVTKKSKELWTLKAVNPGDFIVANRGISHVVGIGRVGEPAYQFRSDRSVFPHTLSVDWESNSEQGITPQGYWAFVTVLELSAEDYRNLFAPPEEAGKQNKPTVAAPAEPHPDTELNLIFYGPPGTGKTFRTSHEALKIFGEKDIRLKDGPSKLGPYRNNDQVFSITFHQSYGYENFIEGIRPDVDQAEDGGDIQYKIHHGILKEAAERALDLAGFGININEFCRLPRSEEQEQAIQNAKKVVLIIDEINRANVSRVFGELITLLEPNKRLGAEEELIVTLPYSGDQFGLPANLYVIGTMNTADRSVESLDTALRRRFAFRRVDVAPELLGEIEVVGIKAKKLLEIINERIVQLLDEDHKIGHSYFMKLGETGEQKEDSGLAALNRIFDLQVIPLLEEYFYGDLGRAQLVLGKNFIERKNSKTKLASSDHENRDDFGDRAIWEVKNRGEWTAEHFRSILAGRSENTPPTDVQKEPETA